MPVALIGDSLTLLGKAGAGLSGDLMYYLRNPRERDATKCAIARALEKMQCVKKLPVADRQLVAASLTVCLEESIPQVPDPAQKEIIHGSPEIPYR